MKELSQDEQYLTNLLKNIFESSKINMSNDNYLGIDVLKKLENEFGSKLSLVSEDHIKNVSATDGEVIERILKNLDKNAD